MMLFLFLEVGSIYWKYVNDGQLASEGNLKQKLCQKCQECKPFYEKIQGCEMERKYESSRHDCKKDDKILRSSCVLLRVSFFKRLFITGASRRLEPVIKCCLFLSFFQCLVSRAPLSAATKSLS